MTDTNQNSTKELMAYFNGDGQPECKTAEFLAFWKGLSDKEKAEFKDADLSK
jgi:hypothetical protein